MPLRVLRARGAPRAATLRRGLTALSSPDPHCRSARARTSAVHAAMPAHAKFAHHGSGDAEEDAILPE
jgi:hypothetical protein